MTINTDTKTIYLVVGNDPLTKDKLMAIDMLKESEVWVIYSNKITPECKADIDFLAQSYRFVTLDCVKKSRTNRISTRLVQRIQEIHSCYPYIQVVLLSTMYRTKELLRLADKGVFIYGEALDVTIPTVQSKQIDEEDTVMEAGGKMHILIDYENVGTTGLNGAEYLCEDDTVTLFYSLASSNIERQHIEAMEKQSGGFNIVKLRTVGKNGLDFYIAVKVGQMAELYPDSKVLIVTKDSGYQAIRDYCQSYTALKNRVIIKGDIEEGIVAMDGDTARRKTILNKRERLSIESEYAYFEERSKLQRDIIEACRGTEYEGIALKILEMVDSAATPRDRYLSSLRMFGRNDGAKIYRLIKEAV